MVLKKFLISITSNSKIWLLLPLLAFVAVIWKNSDKLYLYSQSYVPRLEYSRYQNSAYFQGDKADYILSDEQVNVIRGIEQLIFKKDPLNTLPGHPFLASYIFALSAIFLGSPLFASLAAFVLCLVFFYAIGKQLNSNTALISFFAALFILDPLLNESLFSTMLDIYLCLFSMIAVYFFLLFQKNHKQVFISLCSLFVGFMLATKFYPATLPLMATFFLVILKTQDFVLFKKSLIALPFAVLGFLAGNFTFFLHHLDIISFVRYQRFIQSWWAGSPSVPPFLVFGIIFKNQWQTWWGTKEVLSLPYWTPLWALLLLDTLRVFRFLKNPQTYIFLFWVVLSFAMFSFMAIYPRHLLAVLPALYLIPLIGRKSNTIG
jgi:hypothetical protein